MNDLKTRLSYSSVAADRFFSWYRTGLKRTAQETKVVRRRMWDIIEIVLVMSGVGERRDFTMTVIVLSLNRLRVFEHRR